MAKPRGRPFQAGNNASTGRPAGSRNQATAAVQMLFEKDAEALSKVCIERALKGDAVALRLCLERILPPSKDTPVCFDMPEVQTLSDSTKAANAILQAISRGEITPGAGERLMALLESFRRIREATDLEDRLRTLEEDMPVRTQVETTGCSEPATKPNGR